MQQTQEKCVLILDRQLPPGLLANTAAILGVTLGKALPQIVGDDIRDGSGTVHPGIIRFPIPVLTAGADDLKALRTRLLTAEFSALTVLDFSQLAQSCKTYGDYLRRMAAAPEAELCYLGLAICGDKHTVNRITGNLPLLR